MSGLYHDSLLAGTRIRTPFLRAPPTQQPRRYQLAQLDLANIFEIAQLEIQV